MSNILLWVNTYNRLDLLERLLNHIHREQKDHLVDLFVFDDSSSIKYQSLKSQMKYYYRFDKHQGKANYWKIVRHGLSIIKKNINSYDYFIKIDDDMQLCPNFFNLVIERWDKIIDAKKATLDILSIPHQRGKTLLGNLAQIKKFTYKYYMTQWVDMNFIFNPQVLTRIEISMAGKVARNTSGVGLYLTRYLTLQGYHLYQTDISFLVHDHHLSQMHQDVAKRKLITKALR